MYAIKLTFVLTLCVGCLAELAQGDAIRHISQALMTRPAQEKSANAFVTAAENFLETQTRGVHLFNGDTVSLLKKFIAAGKAIQDGDCSERSHQLISNLPVKKDSAPGSSWEIALKVYKREHATICSKKLHDSEKELYPTLDHEQLNQVEQLTKIAIPTVRGGDHLDRLKAGESKQWRVLRGLLLQYIKEKAEGLPVAESFELYITQPCGYYTRATSSIFETQINHHSDFEVEDEEFNRHFLGYQLCRLFEKEKSKLLSILELKKIIQGFN